MTTKLTRINDELGFVLDDSIVERFGIDENSEVVVTLSDEGIFLKPIRFASDEQVESMTGRDHARSLGDPQEVGVMNPIFLTVDQVLKIQKQQLTQDGGLAGVRDWNLLESAAMQARMTWDGVYLHEGLFLMAAAYLFHLVKNHPFIDANKRAGLVTALLFLELNGFVVADPDQILYDTTINVAEGKLGKSELAEVFHRLAVGPG